MNPQQNPDQQPDPNRLIALLANTQSVTIEALQKLNRRLELDNEELRKLLTKDSDSADNVSPVNPPA